MKTPLISVIVPVYKVEKYLRKCVDSIIFQTYKNLEIILVDDGSPDGCPAICDEYALSDSRIKVIHKKNGGLSDARNVGFDNSNGEYVGFIDSDDYIEPDMYQSLIETAQKHGAELVVCDFDFVYENGDVKSSNSCFVPDEVNEPASVYKKMTQHSSVYNIAWNRLYKREVCEKVKFPVGKQHEDEFTAHRFYGSCTKIAICAKVLYHYLQRTSSIMSSDYSPTRLDAIEALYDRYVFWKNQGYITEAKWALHTAYNLLSDALNRLAFDENKKLIKEKVSLVGSALLKNDFSHGIKLYLKYYIKKFKRG